MEKGVEGNYDNSEVQWMMSFVKMEKGVGGNHRNGEVSWMISFVFEVDGEVC